MLKFLRYKFYSDFKLLLIHHLLIILTIILLMNNINTIEANSLFISIISMFLTFLISASFFRSCKIIENTFFSKERYLIFSLDISKEKIILSNFIYSIFYLIFTLFTVTFASHCISLYQGLTSNFKIDSEIFQIFLLLSIFAVSGKVLVFTIAKIVFNSCKIGYMLLALGIFMTLAVLISVDLEYYIEIIILLSISTIMIASSIYLSKNYLEV